MRPARVVLDARADARETEGAQSLAQVAVADEVPLAGDELQAVRVDHSLHLLVAADGVVLERDRLALRDRRLQLGQGGGRLVRLGHHGEWWSLGLGEELGTPLREAEQGQPQRLGVGEAVPEDGEARGQGRELLAVQRHRLQVVRVRRQAVQLGGGVRERVLVGLDLDAELLQLEAVLVEAPLEGLLGHERVALDPAADLGDAHRLAAAGQEQGDERETPHELVGVLAEAFFADSSLGHGAAPAVDDETPALLSGRRRLMLPHPRRAGGEGEGPGRRRSPRRPPGADPPPAVDQTAAASLAAAAMIASNSAPRSAGNGAAGAARISATFSCAFSVVLLAPAFFQPS